MPVPGYDSWLLDCSFVGQAVCGTGSFRGKRIGLPPAVKPRPQSWAIWLLGGSLSGNPKKVILTELETEQACVNEGMRREIEMRFVVRNVVGFIFESRRGGWFGLVCVYVGLMVGRR